MCHQELIVIYEHFYLPWHAGVFSLIRQLSETVILPIAGMVLTFVATYELIPVSYTHLPHT